MICGIDPGKKGGLCVIDMQGKIVDLEIVKHTKDNIDLPSIKCFIKQYKDKVNMFYVERPHAIKLWGVSVSFKLGLYCGNIEGILAGLEAPYTLVKPKAWQAVMHEGTSPEIPAKERSLQVVQRLVPEQKFMINVQSKKPHDGLVDAFLIAKYGLSKTK